MKKNYELNGMTCTGCATKVTGALLQLTEVQQVDVQLNPQRAVVTMSKPLDVAQLQARIGEAGQYTIKEALI